MERGYKFGTFKGVFTPSLLATLGIILYLRMGWAIGNVGLGGTLLVVSLSMAVSLVTALSVSSLATNMRVRGGGAYYIISRSLGVEAGAAVGIPLFLAQAVTISFYIAGFRESVAHLVPGLSSEFVGLATLAVLAVVILASSSLGLQLQYVVLGVTVLSLVVIPLGGGRELVAPAGELPSAVGFWRVLAVYFPAATGMLTGISMSGDLARPRRSIPLGVGASLLVSYLVYVGMAFYLDYRVADRAVLVGDPLVLEKLASHGVVVLAGIWLISLSSAMGKLLSAPRTLQALAVDRVLPSWLGRTFGRNREPRVATGVVIVIGALGVVFGSIDVIAPVLSMFYLTTFGLLNLAAGMEELMGNPSWRPSFRLPAAVSLLGALSCFGMMFMINAGATFGALLFVAVVFWLMERRTITARWGDMRLGLLMLLIRKALQQLGRHAPAGHNWRPNLLVLAGAPGRRWHLVSIAAAISNDRSLMTIASIIPESSWSLDREASIRATVRGYLRRHRIESEVRIQPGRDHWAGARELLRAYGYGPLQPNTLLIGAPKRESSHVAFAGFVRQAVAYKRNLLVVLEGSGGDDGGGDDGGGGDGGGGRIDVWWRGRSHNAAFMLAVAGLIRRRREQAVRLRLCQIVDGSGAQGGSAVEFAERSLREFVDGVRVDADVHVVVAVGEHPLERIRRESAGASVVFLGVRGPLVGESDEGYAGYYRGLRGYVAGLPVTVLGLAAEGVDFRGIFGEG